MLGKLCVPDKFVARLVEQGLSLLSIIAEHAEALHELVHVFRHDLPAQAVLVFAPAALL